MLTKLTAAASVALYLLLLLQVVAPSSIAASQAPTFELPTFDYSQLTSGDMPTQLLNALKTDGIVSVNNIPYYAAARAAYLDQGALCAVKAATNASAGVEAPEFIIGKTLQDGTERYTIRMPSGRDQDATEVANTTEDACPGYAAAYQELSALLEWVVVGVSAALDSTSFTTRDGYQQVVTSRKLMTDAVRLDHYHAYYAAESGQRRLTATDSTSSGASVVDDLSLELHEDDGMFIAFPTPAFYSVDTTTGELELVTVTGSSDDKYDGAASTGLVIQTHDGTRVRPVLTADSVTLMVGTGYNQWVDASENLPAVMHGMRMPDVSSSDSSRRLLRSWFGKMTLLPGYQRMLRGDVTFEEHANATTRFVNDRMLEADHHLVGCAPGRKLVASADAECTYQSCTTKSGATAPSEGCDVVCNRSHSTDAAECAASCTCSASSHTATTCWMLCVLDLDTCDLTYQSCSGQAKVCSSTPTPTTAAPSPTTAAPTPTTSIPSTTTSIPSTTTTTPSTTTTTPSTTTDSPSTTTETPSSTTDSPSVTTDSPSATYHGGAC
jgi:hypothetical protein